MSKSESDRKLPSFLRDDSETREIFHRIEAEIVDLVLDWRRILHLYGEQETVDLLNSAAPATFCAFQNALEEQVLMKIARLTDPAVQGRFENFSLELLKDHLRPDIEEERLKSIDAAYSSVLEVVQDLRQIRRKRLAHSDKKAVTGAETLPELSKSHIEDALDAIQAFVNELHCLKVDGIVDYKNSIATPPVGENLMGLLRLGLEFEDLRWKALRGELDDSKILSAVKQVRF